MRMFRHIHTHACTDTHTISQITQQVASTLYQSIFKKFTLLQNMYTRILTILLHHHLAGNLVLINCENVIS